MKHKVYPHYKPSGIDWLGDIPEQWKIKRAKFCSHINMGQSPNSEDCNLDEIGLPFLQGDLTPNYVPTTIREISTVLALFSVLFSSPQSGRRSVAEPA